MGTAIYSPRFKSKDGYTFQMGLYPNGTAGYQGELGAYAHLTSGDDVDDESLIWPARWKQITMMLMDQNADIRRRMSNQRSITTDPTMMLEGVFIYVQMFQKGVCYKKSWLKVLFFPLVSRV